MVIELSNFSGNISTDCNNEKKLDINDIGGITGLCRGFFSKESSKKYKPR